MAAFTVTVASVAKYDLTNAAVNPQAYNQPTPRQGGFTIQNRMDFDNITAPTATKGKANILTLVKIPPRTIVKDIIFTVPPGGTTPAHKYTDASGSALSAASAGKSANLAIGYIWFKKASAYNAGSLTSTAQDADEIADLAITKKTGAVAGMPAAWTASNPEYGAVNVLEASFQAFPHYAPYGAWLVAQIEAGASADSVYGQLTGDLHVIVNADYMPE